VGRQIVGVSASDISPSIITPEEDFLLAPAHLDSPTKRAVKWLCVCVCVLYNVVRSMDSQEHM